MRLGRRSQIVHNRGFWLITIWNFSFIDEKPLCERDERKVAVMVTVATREREIGDLEGFDIVVIDRATGGEVNRRQNGVLGPYPFFQEVKGHQDDR